MIILIFLSLFSKHEQTTFKMKVTPAHIRDFNTVDIMFPLKEHSKEIRF